MCAPKTYEDLAPFGHSKKEEKQRTKSSGEELVEIVPYQRSRKGMGFVSNRE